MFDEMFEDIDLNKVDDTQEWVDVNEEVVTEEWTEPTEDVETEDVETEDVETEDVETEEEVVTEEWTETDEWVETTEGDIKDSDKDLSDFDVDALLNEVLWLNEEVKKEEDALWEAIAREDFENIKKSYEEVRRLNEEKDITIKELQWRLDMTDKEMQRLIDEKTIAEHENISKSRLLSHIDSDPSLKALAAYKSRIDSDPAMRDRYIDVLKTMFTEATWVDMDELVNKSKESDKDMLSPDTEVWATWEIRDTTSWPTDIGWVLFE